MPDWFTPQEPDYGNDCALCYPANLTPRIFGVSIAEMLTGDWWYAAQGQPPNGLYTLTQKVGFPCEWEVFPVPALHLRLRFNVAWSDFSIIWAGIEFLFYAIIMDTCKRFFVNSAVTPVNNWMYGGQADVVALWEVTDPIEDVTPIVDPDVLFKYVPRSDGKRVISYTDRWGDTKFKLLFDPTA